MKVRTVTVGVCLLPTDFEFMRGGGDDPEGGGGDGGEEASAVLARAASFAMHAKAMLEEAGFEVQTVRICTNSIEEYADETNMLAVAGWIDSELRRLGVSIAAVGRLTSPAMVRLVPDLVRGTALSCTAELASPYDREGAEEAARAVLRIASETDRAEGNFRFAVSAQCPAGIPYFPVSYHGGVAKDAAGRRTSALDGRAPCTFAIGTECSDVLCEAFAAAGGDMRAAEEELRGRLGAALGRLERVALELEHEHGVGGAGADAAPVSYLGVDASMCPGTDAASSVARGFESLGLGRFGGPGTLAVSALTTAALKSVPVKLCGYSGLMLPVCEDAGLARRGAEGLFSVPELLLYSAVCGIGLDCVPVPGDSTPAELAAVFLDVTALATRLRKPLAARLFPVPGASAGDTTRFDSPYLVNTSVLSLGAGRGCEDL